MDEIRKSTLNRFRKALVVCFVMGVVTVMTLWQKSNFLPSSYPPSDGKIHRILASPHEYPENAVLKADLKALKGLFPLKDVHSIMFWRLQKVGSSTMLSILMSYGYRYNLIPKRKSNSNAFCRVLGSTMLAAYGAMKNEENISNMSAFVPATTLGRPQELHAFAQSNTKDFSMATIESLRKYVNSRLPGMEPQRSPAFPKGTRFAEAERQSAAIPYKIVLSHELCNFNADMIKKYLPLAFPVIPADHNQAALRNPLSESSVYVPVDELFMVRDPLSRSISVYYFWGELYKMMKHKRSKIVQPLPKVNETEKALFLAKYHNNPAFKTKIVHEVAPENDRRRLALRSNRKMRINEDRKSLTLGGSPSDGLVKGPMFTYHGNESTVPPVEVAIEFAKAFPYKAGMPGPTLSWSAFANTVEDAIKRVKSDKLMTVVLERLDESLVVLRHHLGWSLADVVVTKQRKALSSHPKVKDWPKIAVDILSSKLKEKHEYDVYSAAINKLDERIDILRNSGINFDNEVQTLKEIRQRVSQVQAISLNLLSSELF